MDGKRPSVSVFGQVHKNPLFLGNCQGHCSTTSGEEESLGACAFFDNDPISLSMGVKRAWQTDCLN
jgi:hypothetical protein